MIKYILLTLLLIFIIIYIIQYTKQIGKIQVYHQNNELVNKLDGLNKTYFPNILFPIVDYMHICLMKEIEHDYILEKIDTNNNTYIKWVNLQKNYNQNKPIIVVVYGASGIFYIYKNDFIYKCIKEGWIICNIVLQGQKIDKDIVSNSKSTNVISYDFLKDIKKALEVIQFKYPNNPLYLYGVSMGALFILNLLQTYSDIPVNGAICISSPWNLGNTFKYWQDNNSFDLNIFENRYIRFMRSYLTHNRNLFTNINDYKNSYQMLKNNPELINNLSKTNVESINVNTFVIHSKHDTITPITNLPLDKLKKNNKIITAILPFGNHNHFLDIFNSYYIDAICFDYIKKTL